MFRKYHPPVGARPGTLVISPDSPATQVKLVRYCQSEITEHPVQSLDDIPDDLREDEQIWLDVQGFGNEPLIRSIVERFGVHPLAQEDLVNVPQVPKSEPYGEQQLIIINVTDVENDGRIRLSQVGMVLGKQFLLTFHKNYNELLQPVRERLRLPTSNLRQYSSDYLAYVVLDTAVDTYYPAIEAIVGSVEELEARAISEPKPELLRDINKLKNQLSNVRRSIWPQREVLQSLIHSDSQLFTERVRLYLRDTGDHCIQASDVIDMYREMASGLFNTYLSAVAHRSNEIMKFLTVISSVFVPLTFVAGIYGMNFPDMPEFSYPFAYSFFWILISCMSGGMIAFFLKTGWIKPFFLSTDTNVDDGNALENSASDGQQNGSNGANLPPNAECDVKMKRAA